MSAGPKYHLYECFLSEQKWWTHQMTKLPSPELHLLYVSSSSYGNTITNLIPTALHYVIVTIMTAEMLTRGLNLNFYCWSNHIMVPQTAVTTHDTTEAPISDGSSVGTAVGRRNTPIVKSETSMVVLISWQHKQLKICVGAHLLIANLLSSSGSHGAKVNLGDVAHSQSNFSIPRNSCAQNMRCLVSFSPFRATCEWIPEV